MKKAIKLRKKTFDENFVLHQAMLVFWEKGFDSTSIGDLEEKTGVIRTSLYHSFQSKEGIFLKALDIYLEEQCASWCDILEGPGSVIQVLDALFDNVIQHNCDPDTPTGCLIAINSMAANTLKVSTKRKLEKGYHQIIDTLEKLFERSIKSGEIDSANVKAPDLALYVMSSIQGIMLLSRALNNQIDFLAIKTQTIRSVDAMIHQIG